MSKRWLEKDNFIQDVQTIDEKIIITHAQDIDPYLKAAQAERKGNFQDNKGYSLGGNMRKVASIPDLVYTQWIKEDPELAHDTSKLLRKIKSVKEKGFDFTVVDRI